MNHLSLVENKVNNYINKTLVFRQYDLLLQTYRSSQPALPLDKVSHTNQVIARIAAQFDSLFSPQEQQEYLPALSHYLKNKMNFSKNSFY